MERRFCGLEKTPIFSGLGEGTLGSPLAGREVGSLWSPAPCRWPYPIFLGNAEQEHVLKGPPPRVSLVTRPPFPSPAQPQPLTSSLLLFQSLASRPPTPRPGTNRILECQCKKQLKRPTSLTTTAPHHLTSQGGVAQGKKTGRGHSGPLYFICFYPCPKCKHHK